MNILLVDDSNFVRQFIKKYLLQINPSLEFKLAGTGEEGFNFFLEKKPDLIITDLLMPGMGGEAFVKSVREIDKDIKIIVLSADVQKSVKEELKELNVTAFLNKPVTLDNVNIIFDLIEEK